MLRINAYDMPPLCRIAKGMIEEAERKGELIPGKVRVVSSAAVGGSLFACGLGFCRKGYSIKIL